MHHHEAAIGITSGLVRAIWTSPHKPGSIANMRHWQKIFTELKLDGECRPIGHDGSLVVGDWVDPTGGAGGSIGGRVSRKRQLWARAMQRIGVVSDTTSEKQIDLGYRASVALATGKVVSA